MFVTDHLKRQGETLTIRRTILFVFVRQWEFSLLKVEGACVKMAVSSRDSAGTELTPTCKVLWLSHH